MLPSHLILRSLQLMQAEAMRLRLVGFWKIGNDICQCTMSATLFQADGVLLVEVQVGSASFSIQHSISKSKSGVRNIQSNRVALLLERFQDDTRRAR